MDGTSQTSCPEAGFRIGLTASPGVKLYERLSSHQNFLSAKQNNFLYFFMPFQILKNRAEA
jgi:hypothetical protein